MTIMTSTFFPGTADAAAAQAVTVQSGETVSDLTIRLVVVPAFQVSGVVVDEAGAPASDVMVMLMDGRQGADSLLSLSMEPRSMSQQPSAPMNLTPSKAFTSTTGERSSLVGGWFLQKSTRAERFSKGNDVSIRA